MTSHESAPQDLSIFALGGPALDEMELLAGGLLSPADGYCLPQDIPGNWPVPFTLSVPAAMAEAARTQGALLLSDPDGTPLVRMDVTALAQASAAMTYVAGRLSVLRPAEHPPVRPLRIVAPLGLDTGPHTVAAIFSAPPRSSDIALAIVKAREQQGRLLLIAACGHQPHGGYTVVGLVDELLLCAAQVPAAAVGLLVLPALDLATDVRAEALRDAVLENLGAATVLDFTCFSDFPGNPPAAGSGTDKPGTVVFLTGLSGSGKSTLARAMAQTLQRTGHRHVALLDGDDVRRILSPGLGFSREAREENIRRLGWVAARISEAGGLVICAPIAPYAQTRSAVRAMAEAVGGFILVHVSTPLAVCEERDRKGLYAQARRGKLADFTGISAPYEWPDDADVRLDLGVVSVDDAVATVLRALAGRQPADARNLPAEAAEAVTQG